MIARFVRFFGVSLAIGVLAVNLPFPGHGTLMATPVASVPVRSEHSVARMLLPQTTIEAGRPFYVALELRSEPHWHTYWINPGDSGLATSIRWELPPGFQAGPILWPTPRRISTPPLMSYGYGSDDTGPGETLLLSRITPPSELRPGSIQLAAAVEWLECREICLPGEGRFQLRAVVGPGDDISADVETSTRPSDPQLPAEFSRALAQLPRGMVAPLAGVRAEATIHPEYIGLTIVGVPTNLTIDPNDVYFFAEQEGLVAHAEPQLAERSSDKLKIRIPRDLTVGAQPGEQLRGVLRIAGRSSDSPLTEAWRIEAPVVTGGIWNEAGEVLGMLALALLGGMLLNLMPCVLPVLSLKVLALIRSAGESRAATVAAGVAFAAGVLASFLALAGLLLMLQAAGAAVGWGYQLQSPGFVFVLLALVGGFALSLLGVFEIGALAGLTDALPGMLVPRAPGAGVEARSGGGVVQQVSAARSGHILEHFGAGILATLLATPCTAPFMGTAMGFAFTRSAPVVLLIFTALGLGMALPYLLFTAYPRGLTWLPAPGRWMESFKQLSGFLLLGTAVWLLWIFGRLAGADAQAVAVAALLGIGLAAYIYGRWGTPVQAVGRRLLARLLAAALLLLSLAVGLWAASVFAPGANAMGSAANDAAGEVQRWEKFSPERLSELRAAGRPVFIDFTADWCLSCKVNEALTFRSPEVWTAMADRGIVALKADWTRRDPEISRALRGYGRSGVPVYVLYAAGPSAPPVLLPEVLSESLFLAALEALPEPQGQTDQEKLRSPDSGR